MKILNLYSPDLIIMNINCNNDIVRYAKSWQKMRMATIEGIHFECPHCLAKRHVYRFSKKKSDTILNK